MTEFNISSYIFNEDELRTKESRGPTFDGILDWIYENVGEETFTDGFTSPVYKSGPGWEIITRKESSKVKEILKSEKDIKVISWHLCLEDDRAAVLFALRWGIKNGSI